VVHGYPNDNGVYTLFVTDYSINPAFFQTASSWCPKGLENRVLQIELWDKASQLGPAMVKGEFYTLGNVRMKLNRGGYLEGKLVEPKVRLLEADGEDHNDLELLKLFE
jgi:hypothetical protein